MQTSGRFSNVSKTLDIDEEFVTNVQPATAAILTVRRNLQFALYVAIHMHFKTNEIT